MTTTTPLLTATDPRPAFAAAVDVLLATADVVRPDQLTAPTPCAEFDVEALLVHVRHVLRRIATAGRGTPVDSTLLLPGAPAEGWTAALRAAAGEQAAVWADDTVLDAVLPLPFGTLPGRAALATWVGEITTHTWDLAAATGQTPAWDDAAAAVGLAAILGKLPAAGRGPGIPFRRRRPRAGRRTGGGAAGGLAGPRPALDPSRLTGPAPRLSRQLRRDLRRDQLQVVEVGQVEHLQVHPARRRSRRSGRACPRPRPACRPAVGPQLAPPSWPIAAGPAATSASSLPTQTIGAATSRPASRVAARRRAPPRAPARRPRVSSTPTEAAR